MPSGTRNKNNARRVIGLRYWMLRVLEECEKVSKNFDPDPVHDLRVSLRRCRSLADGLMALDPDPAWKAMKKAGKRLFRRLGDLRDTQVMMEWVEKLEPNLPNEGVSQPIEQPEKSAGDKRNPATEDHHEPVSRALREILHGREKEKNWMPRSRSKSLIEKSGGSGVDPCLGGLHEFAREAHYSNILRLSAGQRRANCTGRRCATDPRRRFTDYELASRNFAISWRIFFRRSTRPGAMV